MSTLRRAPVLRGVLAATARGGRVSERRRRCREQALAYKVVRPSTVTVTLTAPDGAVAAQESGGREPGSYDVAFPSSATAAPTAEGELHRNDRASASRRRSLDAHGHRDRRPGAELDGDATLRRQLDARLKIEPTRLVLRRTAVAPRRSAGRRRAARVRVAVEAVEESSSARSRTSASRRERKRSHGTGAPTGASSSSVVATSFASRRRTS